MEKRGEGRSWVCNGRKGKGSVLVGWGSSYLSNNFHIRGAGPIARSHGVDDSKDIPLYHAHELEVVFAPRHVAELFDEEHDVGAVVHVVL